MSSPVRRFRPEFRWDEVEELAYKSEGTHFRAITRQVLFDGPHDLGAQLRYFEIAPGGHSTLERHEHVHAVLVLRGRGRALVGDTLYELAPHDLVTVPPRAWHQFRPEGDESFGFLCLVDCERDRPERPDEAALATLMANPALASFLRV